MRTLLQRLKQSDWWDRPVYSGIATLLFWEFVFAVLASVLIAMLVVHLMGIEGCVVCRIF